MRSGEGNARVAAEGELAELGEDEAGVRVGGEASLEGLEVVELGGGGEERGGGDACGD